MTTEPETVRPEDLKVGDRVRIEQFCTVHRVEGSGAYVRFDVSPKCVEWLGPNALAHATITRLPPPVDPDLLLAREAAASDDPVNRYVYIVGGLDWTVRVRIALAAIKLAKEQS